LGVNCTQFRETGVKQALLSSRQLGMHERDVLKIRMTQRADQITLALAENYRREGSTSTNQKCRHNRNWTLKLAFERVHVREI